MKDLDSHKLRLIYEDLTGADYPQYGSSSPISTAVMGTEDLRSAYVDVPEKAGNQSSKDDEDMEGDSPLQKAVDEIRNLLNKIENKQEEENIVDLDESVLTQVLGAASGFASGIEAGGAGSMDNLVSNVKGFQKEKKDKEGKAIGKDNPPVVGAPVQMVNNPDVTGVITKIAASKENYIVQLVDYQDVPDDVITKGKKVKLVENPRSDLSYVFVKIMSDRSSKPGWSVKSVQEANNLAASNKLVLNPSTGKPDMKITTWGGKGFGDWIYIPYALNKTVVAPSAPLP